MHVPWQFSVDLPSRFSILIPPTPTFLLHLSRFLSWSGQTIEMCLTVSFAAPQSHVGSSMMLNRGIRSVSIAPFWALRSRQCFFALSQVSHRCMRLASCLVTSSCCVVRVLFFSLLVHSFCHSCFVAWSIAFALAALRAVCHGPICEISFDANDGACSPAWSAFSFSSIPMSFRIAITFSEKEGVCSYLAQCRSLGIPRMFYSL